MRKKTLKGWSGAVAALLVLGLLAYGEAAWHELAGNSGSKRADNSAVRAAFADKRSDVWAEVQGQVVRVLADDNRGDRHQRFIIDIGDSHTVLVAHNIDLAPRVPLDRGSTIRLYGEYEWNPQGGVMHWTHHDPSARRPGGWIELDGQRYR